MTIISYLDFFPFQDETIQDVKNKIQLNLKLSEAIDDIQLHYHSKFVQ